jgi:hypothetical protein
MADYDPGTGSVVQATFRGLLHGQLVMNTFHYTPQTAGGVTGGGAFLDDMFDVLNAVDGMCVRWKAILSSSVTLLECDLQWIYPDRFIKRTYTIGANGDNDNTTTTNLATVISLRGNQADKRSIGTKHIPGLTAALCDAGLIQPAQYALADDLCVRAILPITVGTRVLDPIVFGRARAAYTDPDGTVHPPLPVSKRVITTYIVQQTARVMRRRTVGVGV